MDNKTFAQILVALSIGGMSYWSLLNKTGEVRDVSTIQIESFALDGASGGVRGSESNTYRSVPFAA